MDAAVEWPLDAERLSRVIFLREEPAFERFNGYSRIHDSRPG